MAFCNHARIFIAMTMSKLPLESTLLWRRARVVQCCALFLLCAFVTGKTRGGQTASSASAAESASKASVLYKQGMAALQKGDLDSARGAFEKVVRLAPQSPEGHNSLGLVLLAQNELDSTIKQFQSALKLKPDFVQAHINFANALIRKADLAGALREAREATQLAPNDSETHRTLGRAFDFSKDFDGAIAEFRSEERRVGKECRLWW